MQKIFLLLSLFALSGSAWAQEAAPVKGFMSDPINDPMFPLYVVTAFVFAVALLVIFVAIYILRVLNIFISKAAEEKATSIGVAYVPEPSAASKLWMWINGFRPMEKESEILLDHNYDGITELDNHLPPWWKWLFYATIIWAGIYLVVYHFTDTLPLQDEEYQNEVALAQAERAKLLASKPQVVIDENTLKYENNDQIIQSGRKVFVTNCSSCHMADGQGNIGPNLTDEYWLHGGSIKDIFTTIKNGVQEKGMISWAPVLSPEQIRDVAFYIKSIKGTNPPNPKAPQGNVYTEEVAPAVQADTVKASMN